MTTLCATICRAFLFVLLFVAHFRKTVVGDELMIQEFISESDSMVHQKLQDHACSEVQAWPETMIECAILCAADISCFGLSMDQTPSATARCWLYRECSQPPGVAFSADHLYSMKTVFDFLGAATTPTPLSCQNGGSWLSDQNRCSCSMGWHQQLCQTRSENCTALATSGYAEEITYVNLQLNAIIPGYCKITPSSEHSFLIVLKNDGDHAPFNRTFNDALNSFGEPSSDYWIGINYWHMLSEAGYNKHEIYISVTTDSGDVYTFLLQVTMSISRKGTHLGDFEYVLNVDSEFAFTRNENPTHEITLDKCFSDLEGLQFSTWDNDKDTSTSQNCAAMVGNSWWFKDCDPACNLLGVWPSSGQSATSLQRIRIPGLDLETWGPDSVSIEWVIIS